MPETSPTKTRPSARRLSPRGERALRARQQSEQERLAGRRVYLAPPTHFGVDHLKDLKPTRVSSILDEAASGRFENWVPFCHKMLEDDHVYSTMETLIDTIAGAELVVEPGRCRPERAELAQRAADFYRLAVEETDEWESFESDLLWDGIGIGIGVQEHDFYTKGRAILTAPFWVDPANMRYGRDWLLEYKSIDRVWECVPEDAFIIHTPRTRATVPTKTALLRSVAWIWLFKFWAWTFWINGAERLGNPLITATVPRSAKDAVRQAALDALEELSSDQAAVIEETTGIKVHDVKYIDSAEVWENLISKCDAAISKAVLGSTLNVEITETGGAYAAAESQGDRTITPRVGHHAKQLCGTLKRDHARALFRQNLRLFDGEMPPLPNLRKRFDSGEKNIPPHIFQVLVETGSLRRNQVLEIAGLPLLTKEEGGEDFVQPIAKTPSPFRRADDAPPAGGGGDVAPFARSPKRPRSQRQLTLPKTSRTSSPSHETTNPLRDSLFGTSDDP